jgi:Zn-dependent peptidase ImmA (M78 family)
MATAAQNPTGDGASVSVARNKARALATVYSGPPIPVKEIARKAGAIVKVQTLPHGQETVSALCDFDKGIIYVNAMEEPVRQHYALAHELGHFMLHRDMLKADPDLYTVLPRLGTPLPTPLEAAAEEFAAELLIPRRLLEPVKSAPAAELARIFKVPLDLMERRLKQKNG